MMKKLTIAAAAAVALSTLAMGAAPAEAHGKKFHFGGIKIKFISDYDYCYWKKIKVWDEDYGWYWVKVKVCH